MINDKYVSEMIEKTGRELLGEGNVGEIEKTLGAEDFGEFMKHAPGAMFTLGTQKAGHEEYLLHHPKFDIDERAMPIGTAMLAIFFFLWLAVLSWEDLSVALPMQALNYVLVAFLSQYFLGETVSPLRWAGTVLVCVGVMMITRSSGS